MQNEQKARRTAFDVEAIAVNKLRQPKEIQNEKIEVVCFKKKRTTMKKAAHKTTIHASVGLLSFYILVCGSIGAFDLNRIGWITCMLQVGAGFALMVYSLTKAATELEAQNEKEDRQP